MKSPIYSYPFALLLGIPTVANGDWGLSQMVTRQNGQTTYNAKPVDEKLINPWPAELEAEFQRRAQEIITAQTRDVKAGVNTYFENEKRTYGYLMAHVLGGDTEVALKHLQARDHQHQEWHRETAGIDYYACFTLKRQMRKYFYFGDLLDPEYRKQMYEEPRSGPRKIRFAVRIMPTKDPRKVGDRTLAIPGSIFAAQRICF